MSSSNCYYNFLLEKYTFEEAEKMDLETLAKVFPSCIDGQPLWDRQGEQETKEQFIKGFEILENMDFTRFWKENCLPIINKQCAECNAILKEKIVDHVLSDIQNLKSGKELGNINIYVTYFNYGVSFQLSATSYLTNYQVNDEVDAKQVLKLFVHELIHRFSNDKSRDIYIKTYQSDEFMKQTNHALFVEQGSPSDEEEFVVALEHAISLKNGITTKEEAYSSIFNHYGSCMPVAVIVFDELAKLKELPDDINSWIYNLFVNGTIKVGEIADKVNKILPGYVANFGKEWLKKDN